ncbi:MAG: beta-ketoacyl synthase chain length factor [Azoarcus sp.]|nr:beta-ketoacyl synthase chain length factor [Azoarcus sp.]
MAWAPGLETSEAWRQWALSGNAAPPPAQEGVLPPLKEIPPLLRRRAHAMGRAALHVLSRPELPYQGQPIVLCSRFGEIRRSFDLQCELMREGQVSPQQFSMAVHNATGGLFMMAKKACAPLTALAACEEGALAGLQEAFAGLADGASSLWLLYCEEPLPVEYRPFLDDAGCERDVHFAVLLELVPGGEFHLAPEADGGYAASRTASPLDLFAFLLRPAEESICLSPRGNWTLRRAVSREG